jgi:hypothetical protein
MLMVIFGAGASYDAIPGRDWAWRPPLAKALCAVGPDYAEYIRQFPKCSPIIQHMRLMSQSEDFNLERELALFNAECEADPVRSQHIAAFLFYIHGLISTCSRQTITFSRTFPSNYLELLDNIRRWHVHAHEPVIMITFNYDTLLEDACSLALDFETNTIESYVARDDYKLFKPHGSIDVAQVIDPASFAFSHGGDNAFYYNQLINGFREMKFTGEFRKISGLADLLPGTVSFPAIALPLEEKTDFSWPRAHMEQLTKLMGGTTQLLVVGWRATERHFLRLVQDHGMKPTRTHIVGYGGAADTWDNLQTAGLIGSPELWNDGFSSYVRSRKLRELLQ